MKLNNHNKSAFVKNVFNEVFENYDLMNDLMSFGAHRLWKRELINWLNPSINKKLLDVACGSGDISKLYIEKTKYQCEVDAIDPNNKMLSVGKKRLQKFNNIRWHTGKAEKLKFKDNTFDHYTISFGIRNVSNIDNALKEAFRVLKPGGRFMCLEFSKIQNNNLNKIYKLYSKTIPKIGKFIVGNSAPYEYLINSIESFYNQHELIDLMKEKNFFKVEYRNLTGGVVAIHSGWKI